MSHVPARAGRGPLTGLRPLLGLVVRRNRWFYLAWTLALVITAPMTAAAYETIIDPANAELLITTMSANPTMRAMLGPPYDLYTAGGFTVWRIGTFAAAMAAMMAVIGVVRSTRVEEEDGRTELLRSGAVGRHAPLAAGVIVALAASTALGLLITVSMVAVGEPWPGSIAFGAGTALVATTFAGLGAVTAQLASTGRAARSLGLWILAAAFTLRAVADGASDESALRPLAWASPVEWMALARPYADERWWVLALPLVTTVVLIGAAFALEARRDHGSGMWAVRPGPATGSASLSGAFGLAWRLHRGGVIGWTIGMVLFALALGSLSTSFGDMLANTPQLKVIFERLGGGTSVLIDAFYVAILSIVVVVLTVLALQIFHRLASEEDRGTAELVLSVDVTRDRLLLSHLLLAIVVPVGLLAMTGAGMALNQALAESDWSHLPRIAGAALVLAPGLLVVLGLAVLLHGWTPHLSWLVWVVVGWSLFMIWVGEILNLPSWLIKLTPWAALPQLPSDSMDWPPVLITTALGVLLIATGWVGYRRRDIT